METNSQNTEQNELLSTTVITSIIIALVVGLIAGYLIWKPKSDASEEDANHTDEQVAETSMEHEMNAMVVRLTGLAGSDFDRTFIKEMIAHHQGAVAMAALVQKSTIRPELVQLAKNITEAQTKEIAMMYSWYQKWFGTDRFDTDDLDEADKDYLEPTASMPVPGTDTSEMEVVEEIVGEAEGQE